MDSTKGGDGGAAETAHSSGGGSTITDLLDILDICVVGEELALHATAIAVPMVSKRSLAGGGNEMTRSVGSVKDLDDGGHAAGVGDGATDARESGGRCYRSEPGSHLGDTGDDNVTVPMSSEPGTLRQARRLSPGWNDADDEGGEVMSPQGQSRCARPAA